MTDNLTQFPLYGYCVNNMYFMGIQAGIQSAHSLVRVCTDFSLGTDADQVKARMVNDWATDHETMVVLNGGHTAMLKEVLYLLENTDHDFPFAPFYETDLAEDALSNIAIIAPAARAVLEKLDELRTKSKYIRHLEHDQEWCGGEANYNIILALSNMPLMR
jgi:hypothetical protein